MRLLPRWSLVALLLLPACTQFEVAAQAGYAQLALDGEIGYVSGSTTASISQDVTSAFGLGEDQGAPYGRLAIDMGVPVFSVSGFMFDEQGTGTLSSNFGGNPLLTAGAAVNSDLELSNAKASLAFDISLGPVTISPGLAADYFSLNLEVSDVNGLATETVDLEAPLPMGFLRGTVELGVVRAFVEVGYSEVDIEDVQAKLFDIEAMLVVNAISMVDLFVGYRSLALEVDGLIDNDTFDSDFTIGGFFIGGGLRF